LGTKNRNANWGKKNAGMKRETRQEEEDEMRQEERKNIRDEKSELKVYTPPGREEGEMERCHIPLTNNIIMDRNIN